MIADPSRPTEVQPVADRVLKFWCGEDYLQQDGTKFDLAQARIWYKGGVALDQEIQEKFAGDVRAAAAGEYDTWITSFNGLARLIIMDQFTRNIFRDKPEAYSLDAARAIRLARQMMASGEDKKLTPLQRHWVYSPFQHSESLSDQKDCVRLHEVLLSETRETIGEGPATSFLEVALQMSVGHCKTVEENGRFPHRDAIFGSSDHHVK